MIDTVKQWLFRNPYSSTSLVFLVLAILGWGLLGWGEREFGFLLLLYFIISLGIRLDEISRILGGGRDTGPTDPGEEETVIAQLREIKTLLAEIKAARHHSAERAPEENNPPPES